MRYTSCFLLEHAMAFGRNNVKPCTCLQGYNLCWVKEYHGQPFDADAYLKLRQKYVDLLKKGIVPETCAGCANLEERDWSDEPGIEFIVVGNETKCSCDCFYCWFSEDKEYFNNFKSYNIMPILNSLKEKNLLKNLTIDVVGGECTEYKQGELEEIVNFILSDDNYFIHFFSSGMFYSELIAKVMSASKANIVVSVDSGTKETYEKIKRVKSFDKVWENMAKYSQAGVKDEFCQKGYVVLKYIIIPGINDNPEEFKAFVQKAKESGCVWIRISMEYQWWLANSDKPIPKHLFELLDLVETYRDDFKIEYVEDSFYLWQKRMLEDKSYTGKNPCLNKAGC